MDDNNKIRLSLSKLLLLMILALPFNGNSILTYILIAGLLLFLIIEKKRFRLPINCAGNHKTIQFIAVAFLLTWLIGVINGIIHGNILSNVFHNFIGSICYISFFVFIATSTDDKQGIFRIALCASKVATLLMLIAVVEIRFGLFQYYPASSIDYNGYTYAITSLVEIMTFALLAYSLFDLFVSKKKTVVVDLIWITLSLYITVFKNERGGYLLAFLGIVAVTVYCILFRKLGSNKNRYLGQIMVIIVVILIAIYEYLTPNSILRSIFDPNDYGNSIRYQQFAKVFERFKVFGNGLGTEYSYMIFGELKTGYLIEISYLDLIDKYGLLSLFIFWAYYKTYRLIISGLASSSIRDEYGAFAIGLLSYLFIGVGNPVIFLAYNVLVHCLVLFFLW